MDDSDYKLELLRFLNKLGLKFTIKRGYYSHQIHILGKMQPADFSEAKIYISTEEAHEQV